MNNTISFFNNLRWYIYSIIDLFYLLLFFVILSFLGLHPQHVEIPRLGVQSELLLPADTRATAIPDLSCICNLHYSAWQRQILNPLSEARDWTHILARDNTGVHNPLSHDGNSPFGYFEEPHFTRPQAAIYVHNLCGIIPFLYPLVYWARFSLFFFFFF